LNPKLLRVHYNTRLPRYVVDWLRAQRGSVARLITAAIVEKYEIEVPQVQKKVKFKGQNVLATEKVAKEKKKGAAEKPATP
jgi:hypothetical protein